MDTGEEYPHPKYIRERARDNNSMIEKDQGDEDRYDSVKQHPAAASIPDQAKYVSVSMIPTASIRNPMIQARDSSVDAGLHMA